MPGCPQRRVWIPRAVLWLEFPIRDSRFPLEWAALGGSLCSKASGAKPGRIRPAQGISMSLLFLKPCLCQRQTQSLCWGCILGDAWEVSLFLLRVCARGSCANPRVGVGHRAGGDLQQQHWMGTEAGDNVQPFYNNGKCTNNVIFKAPYTPRNWEVLTSIWKRKLSPFYRWKGVTQRIKVKIRLIDIDARELLCLVWHLAEQRILPRLLFGLRKRPPGLTQRHCTIFKWVACGALL